MASVATLAAFTPKAFQSSNPILESGAIDLTDRSRSGVCAAVGRAAAWCASTSLCVAAAIVKPDDGHRVLHVAADECCDVRILERVAHVRVGHAVLHRAEIDVRQRRLRRRW